MSVREKINHHIAYLAVMSLVSAVCHADIADYTPSIAIGKRETRQLTSQGQRDFQGPSFDCKKSSTEIEKAICDDRHLSALDRRLNAIYSGKRSIPAIRDSVRESQIEWLRTERSKCEHVESSGFDGTDRNRIVCLESAYESRIEALNLLKASPFDASGKPPINFKLMVGSQYSLCRDYVAMLNRTGYIDAPICERKILPGFSKFRAVKWMEITDKEEIKRIKREQIVMERLWSPKLQKKTEDYWLWRESEMDSGGWPSLQKARIDIDHDGQEDTVYRFNVSKPKKEKYGDCGRESSYFIVYDDPDKTRRVYEKRRFSLDGPPDGAHEIFYYDGRAFQDYWNDWVAQYHIKVNELSGLSNQVCGVNIVQQGAAE